GIGAEVFEANLSDQAFTDIAPQLDDMTTGLRCTLGHTSIDGVRDEQAKPVERLVVAIVKDRALLTSGKNGGVTDRNPGFLKAKVMSVGISDLDGIFVLCVITRTQHDGGAGRTEVAAGGANKLQPSLNLGAPVSDRIA